MFDMRSLQLRYFDVTLPNGMRLSVEPPKLKVLKKISSLANYSIDDLNGDREATANEMDDMLDALAGAVAMALSKNKQKRNVTKEYISDNLNIDQIQALLIEYFGWIEEIKQAKN